MFALHSLPLLLTSRILEGWEVGYIKPSRPQDSNPYDYSELTNMNGTYTNVNPLHRT
jgi:hypothetical protein